MVCRADGKARHKLFTAPKAPCMLSCVLEFSPGTQRFGVTLGHDQETDSGYQFVFYPAQNKVEFSGITFTVRNDGLSRMIPLCPETSVSIQLIWDQEVCMLYVDGQVALSSRMYQQKGQDFSVFAVGGGVTVKEASLSVREEI